MLSRRDKPVHQQMFHLTVPRVNGAGKSRPKLGICSPARQVFSVREVCGQTRRGFPLLVNLVLLVDQSKMLGESSQIFRRSQHQVAPRFQRIMQSGDNPSLQNWPQIDQEIAATHQVQVRERRIFHQILFGEDTHIPNRLVDLKASIQPDKKNASIALPIFQTLPLPV